MQFVLLILTWFSSWRKFWRLRVFLAAAAPVFQDHVLDMSGYFSRCDWWIFFKAPVKITIHLLNFTYFAIIRTTSVQYLKCQNFSLTHLSSFPSCSLSQILEVLNKWKWCIFLQSWDCLLEKPTGNVGSSPALLIKHVHHVDLQQRSLYTNIFW